MQITDIKVRKLMQEGRLRAVVSVTIGDELAIHDIKVIEGPTRLFVAMPSRREAGGVFRDIAHPITPAARRQLEDAILAVYRREKAEAEQMQRLPYGITLPNILLLRPPLPLRRLSPRLLAIQAVKMMPRPFISKRAGDYI